MHDICSLTDSFTTSFTIKNSKWSNSHPLVNMQEDLIYTAEQITANSPYGQKNFTPFLTLQNNLFHQWVYRSWFGNLPKKYINSVLFFTNPFKLSFGSPSQIRNLQRKYMYTVCWNFSTAFKIFNYIITSQTVALLFCQNTCLCETFKED